MRLAIELAGDCRDNLVQGNIVTKGLHGDIQGNDRSGRIEGNLTAAS